MHVDTIIKSLRLFCIQEFFKTALSIGVPTWVGRFYMGMYFCFNVLSSVCVPQMVTTMCTPGLNPT
jgi:hypothetical protein